MTWRGGGKGLGSGCVLKVQPIEPAEGLDAESLA